MDLYAMIGELLAVAFSMQSHKRSQLVVSS
jgi:hypothetical protein